MAAVSRCVWSACRTRSDAFNLRRMLRRASSVGPPKGAGGWPRPWRDGSCRRLPHFLRRHGSQLNRWMARALGEPPVKCVTTTGCTVPSSHTIAGSARLGRRERKLDGGRRAPSFRAGVCSQRKVPRLQPDFGKGKIAARDFLEKGAKNVRARPGPVAGPLALARHDSQPSRGPSTRHARPHTSMVGAHQHAGWR